MSPTDKLYNKGIQYHTFGILKKANMSYTEVHLRKTLLPVVTWRLPRDHDTSLAVARAVARSTEHKSQHAPAGTGYGLWHSSTSNCV